MLPCPTWLHVHCLFSWFTCCRVLVKCVISSLGLHVAVSYMIYMYIVFSLGLHVAVSYWYVSFHLLVYILLISWFISWFTFCRILLIHIVSSLGLHFAVSYWYASLHVGERPADGGHGHDAWLQTSTAAGAPGTAQEAAICGETARDQNSIPQPSSSGKLCGLAGR